MPSLGDLLRHYREQRGLSQEDLAALVAPPLSPDTISNVERGRTRPYRHTLEALCQALGVDDSALSEVWATWRAAGTAERAASAESTSTWETTVPAQPTPLIGRDQELQALEQRLLQPQVRLLTLVGPGGVGKTRLAIGLMQRIHPHFADGATFVDLSALREADLVVPTMASALGIRDVGGQPVWHLLRDALRTRSVLLVLDNFEQVLDAAARLAELLGACPDVKLLVTSREPLGLRWEHLAVVQSLRVPDAHELASLDTVRAAPAVALFVERARSVEPRFMLTEANAGTVAEICRRLDGLPLAIELAAARTRLLPPRTMLPRLEQSLNVLVRGGRDVPARQQTLRATFAWSYDLLTAPEQALLRALSVFAGDFPLEAAEAVYGPTGQADRLDWSDDRLVGGDATDVLDLLARLVDRSLVLADEQGAAIRYRMLETVREYAVQKLDEAGEGLTLRRRHAAWCLALAEEAAAAIDGPQEADWLARLEQERDNLRAALSWSLDQGQRSGAQEQLAASMALRLAGSLSRFWELRGYLSAGRTWLSRALAIGDQAPAAERARALRGAGSIAFIQGDFAAAEALFSRSLTVYRDLADEYGIAEAQWNLGRTAGRQGDYAAARGLLEQSLKRYQELGHTSGIATLQYALGVLSFRQGDYAAATARYEASLALHRQLGNKHGIANALAELAAALWEQDQDGAFPTQFELLLEESLALHRDLGEKSGVAAVLDHRGMRAWARGHVDQAQTLLSHSLALYREVENRRGIARVLGQQGLVAYSRRDDVQAAALCRESMALHHAVGEIWEIGRYLWVLGAAMAQQGQPEQAVRLFAATRTVRERLGTPLPPVFRASHDIALAALRDTLGEQAFASTWAEGQTLSVHEAIAG